MTYATIAWWALCEKARGAVAKTPIQGTQESLPNAVLCKEVTIYNSLKASTIEELVLMTNVTLFQRTAESEYQRIAKICDYRSHLVFPRPVLNYDPL